MKFEIFKIGTHTSDKGISKEYTLDDLNFIAQSYNPQEDEAPIVIGHPVDNSPAYGWISSLEVTQDGKLVAEVPEDKLQKDFLSAVQNGRYKKRSISLTPEGKLRHVGFLGGAAPAVKGLADIQFSQPSSTLIEFDINNETIGQLSNDSPVTLSEALPTLPTGQAGGRQVDESKTIDSIQSQLNSINETIKQLNSDFTESQNNELTSKLNNLSNELSNLKSKINKSSFENQLDQKLGDGSLIPAVKEKVLAVSNFASSQNFSGDFSQDKFNTELNKLLIDLIDSFPKVMFENNFAEKPEYVSEKSFDEFADLTVDEEAKALHNKAKALSKKENISYLNAVKKLSVSP